MKSMEAPEMEGETKRNTALRRRSSLKGWVVLPNPLNELPTFQR